MIKAKKSELKLKFAIILLLICFLSVPLASSQNESIINLSENITEVNISDIEAFINNYTNLNITPPEGLPEPNVTEEETNSTETVLNETLPEEVIGLPEETTNETVETNITLPEEVVPKTNETQEETVTETNKTQEITTQIEESIILNDGSKFVKSIDNKSLSIKELDEQKINFENVFNIVSSTPMHYLGDIKETKEWAYEKEGYEIISNEKGLEIIDEDYVCEKGTTKITLSETDGMSITANQNPKCIYYPKQLVENKNKKLEEDLDNINIRTITKIDKNNVKVEFEDDYDPTYATYTGNCSGTCYITGGTYNATLQEGVLIDLGFGEGTVNTSRDWSDRLGGVYSSSWKIDTSVSATECEIFPFQDRINIFCNQSLASNNWTFYPTYVQLKSVYSGGSYRVYNYARINDDYNQTWNGSTNRTGDPYVAWDSSTGTYGLSSLTDPNIFVMIWNESVKTHFEFGTTSWGVMCIGRNDEITSGVPLETQYKQMRRNESAAGNARYVDIMRALKNDITYGDITYEDESGTTIWSKDISAGCGAGWTGDSSWDKAEFRVYLDNDDRHSEEDFSEIRVKFCAGTDEALRVLNVSLCWINDEGPEEYYSCSDELNINYGEGYYEGTYYTHISQSSCGWTPWMNYSWKARRPYFIQWGTNDTYGGNRYIEGCSESRISRISSTVADVSSPDWTSDAWDPYIYDLQEIEGRYVSTDNDVPTINFQNPTPLTSTPYNYIIINTSVYDTSNTSSFIDWQNSLRGWWNFEYSSGNTIYDNSSYGNDATINGNIEISPSGAFGSAAYFGGGNDYISIPQSVINSSTFTISFWEFTSSGADVKDGYWFSDSSDASNMFFRRYAGSENMSCAFGDQYLFGNENFEVPRDIWNHFVITHNSSGVFKVYLNGELRIEKSGSNFAGITSPLYLGNKQSLDRDFEGYIDEFMIFDRVITNQEILSLYNSKENQLYTTFSELSNNQYSFKAITTDEAGHISQTEQRQVTAQQENGLSIDFEYPTPSNNEVVSGNSIYINISTSSENNHSAFIDWKSSLVGWWNFESFISSGVYGTSSYAHFASFMNTLNESNIIDEAARGTGMYSDKTYQYLSVPDSSVLNISLDLSIEFWVYVISSSAEPDVITKGTYSESYSIWLTSTPAIRFALNNDRLTSTSFSSNEWHHVIALRKGDNRQIYIDGVLKANGSYASPISLVAKPLTIFDASSLSRNYKLDEVKVWNRALSQEEINASYNAGTYRLYSNYTSLNHGDYSVKAYVIDSEGNIESTEERTINLGDIETTISFVSPTLDNNSISQEEYVYVNVSTSSSSNTSAFIDWNNSLVGWWNFENVLPNGTVYDSSTYHIDLTMQNFETNESVSGIRGNAIEFDGESTSLNTTNDHSLNITGELTVEAWVKPKSAPNGIGRVVVNQYNYNSNDDLGWMLGDEYGPDDHFRFFVWNQTGSAYAYHYNFFNDYKDQWTHVVGVYKPSQYVRLYINGVKVSEDTSDVPAAIINSNKYAPMIGRRSDASTQGFWNGTIDEVKIWNRAVSEQEINASFNAGSYRLYSNFTNLSNGEYNYEATAIDESGNIVSTETRTVYVGQALTINFTSPTPSNGTQATGEVQVEAEVTSIGEASAFLDWNNSLIGWWNFGSYDGTTIYDNSSFGKNLVLKNGTTITTDGKRGNAAKFTGISNDYIYGGTVSNYSADVDKAKTFEAWFKTYNLAKKGYIIYKSGSCLGYAMQITSSGEMNMFLTTGESGCTNYHGYTLSYSGKTYDDNQWHHMVGIIDRPNKIMKLYVDTELLGTKAIDNENHSNTGTFRVGSDYNGSNTFNGSIDEVKVWDRALSEAEINTSYNAGLYILTFNTTDIGPHSYKAYAIDEFGNIATTETRTLQILPENRNITYLNYTIDEFGNPPDQICFVLRDTSVCFDENGFVS